MKTAELRRRYLAFFEKHGHKVVASDSLAPAGDASVLFTPAGMNQFKEHFLGRKKIDHPQQRAVTCQKCIRAGDIENVGVTPRHHTFFEMLGNFSFGDYFKREAIGWAWAFVTEELKLSPARLAVSVHQTDEDAYRIWRQEIGLPADKIHRLGDKDNFWPADAPTQGPNGPSGPCSEIFYQLDPTKPSFDDMVEIWNLVFTQFDRQGPIPGQGQLNPLPAPNIDTGMGLERTVAAIQGTPSNFETDLLKQLVLAAAERLGIQYKDGKGGPADIAARRIADHLRCMCFAVADGVQPSRDGRGYVLRRILRQAARDARNLGVTEPFMFELVPLVVELYKDPYAELAQRQTLIRDTVEGEEKSYQHTMHQGTSVLNQAVGNLTNRKVLSNALNKTPYVASDMEKALIPLWQSSPRVNLACQKREQTPASTPGNQQSKESFDQVIQRAQRQLSAHAIFPKSAPIQEIKEAISKSLFKLVEKDLPDAQIRIISRLVGSGEFISILDSALNGVLDGRDAFYIYETHGLDIETISTAMTVAGFKVDIKGFETARDTAAAANVERPKDIFGSGPIPDLKRHLADKKPLGGDFQGYAKHTLDGCEVLLIASQPKPAKKDAKPEPGAALATAGKPQGEVLVVLSTTPFYPEMGGQVGDTGFLIWPGGKAKVIDTTKDDPLILHKVAVIEGELKPGAKVTATIDAERRARIEIHHTSTHLLQHALRQVVGAQVEQKGSAVYPDRLRFDFSCPRAITPEELAAVENKIGELVRQDFPVTTREMPIDEARKLGAMALFGEKYGDRVRVVGAGPSTELCGGCHVPSTGRIGGLKITMEEAAGQGVRRIEAVAGEAETVLFREYEKVVKTLVDRFRCRPNELTGRVEALDAEKLAQFKEIERLKGQLAVAQAQDLLTKAISVSDGKLLIADLSGSGAGADDLKTLAEAIQRTDASVAVIFGAAADGKVALVAAMPKALVAKGAHAGNLIKELAKLVGGGGGGKPDFAQAGGRDGSKLPAAIAKAKDLFDAQLAAKAK